jgi:hypothetical protein
LTVAATPPAGESPNSPGTANQAGVAPLPSASDAATNASVAQPGSLWGDTPTLHLDDDQTQAGDDWSVYPDHFWLKTPIEVWFPSVNGHVGIKTARGFSKNFDVDASFSDLTKHLQLGVSPSVEAGVGPLFVGFQGMWLQWKNTGITGPLGFSNIDVKSNFGFANLYFGYHFLDLPLSNGDPYPKLGLDGLIGAGWTYMYVSIRPQRINGASADVNWFDPYVGLRGRIDLTQQIDIQAMGTIGGFDVDYDKLFWQANAIIEYRFNPGWSAFVGYQAMSYDYDRTLVFDVNMNGPIIGLNHRW